MKAKLTTKGFEDLLEQMAAMGKDVDAAAGAALIAGADVAVDGMQRRVAVDTGNLKDSVKASEVKREGNLIFVAVGLVGADKNTARYGNAQEYGTRKMPAHPYIRPTMDEDKGKIRKAMTEVLKKELEP